MTFNWTESAEGGSPKLPEGWHRVKCAKVMRANKDGKEYTSKEGDPQVYTVWENANGESGLAIFTISDKAAWTLAQMLKCAGADLARMEKEGVTPDQFADVAFAEKQILNRECWVYATIKGQYVNLDFKQEAEVPDQVIGKAAAPAGASTQVDEDDIPF